MLHIMVQVAEIITYECFPAAPSVTAETFYQPSWLRLLIRAPKHFLRLMIVAIWCARFCSFVDSCGSLARTSCMRRPHKARTYRKYARKSVIFSVVRSILRYVADVITALSSCNVGYARIQLRYGNFILAATVACCQCTACSPPIILRLFITDTKGFTTVYS